MLLLLKGSSDVARAALANVIVKKHKQWRYLAPSEIETIAAQFGFDDPTIAAFILSESIRDMHEDGFHVILPCEAGSTMHEGVADEMGEGCVTVLLATDDDSEEAHDHRIEAKGKSALQLYKAVAHLLG